MRSVPVAARNETAKPRKGKTLEHTGGKGVGLLLKGWQATAALLLPIVAVAVMWGATQARVNYLESRAEEDRKERKEDHKKWNRAVEGIEQLLQDHAERLVKLEVWRDGPARKDK